MPRSPQNVIGKRLKAGEELVDDPTDPTRVRLVVPSHLSTATGRTILIAGVERHVRKDRILIGALKRAHAMLDNDRHGPRLDRAPASQHARRIAALALLAPDIQRDILEGRQPVELTLEALTAADLPPLWEDQRRIFGWTHHRADTKRAEAEQVPVSP